MASLIYNNMMTALVGGDIDFGVDTFYAMLVTSSYVADKDAHTHRDDVTNEVSGTGYTAGGAAIVCTPTPDAANDRMDLEFGDVSWPSSTITARGAVIYKSRGGASSADELIAYIDFGSNQSSSGTTFTLHPTAPLRLQN